MAAAGFLDALVLDPLDALSYGQTQAGFNVTFDYIGQALPGALSFDINDSEFNVVFSGETVVVPSAPIGGQVPEPGIIWLTLLAAGGLAATRVKSKTRQAKSRTQCATNTPEAA